MAPNELHSPPSDIFVEVDLKKLPTYTQLRNEVNAVINKSTLFERYGVDWCYLLGAIATVPIALQLLKSDNAVPFIIATIILGFFHSIVANKVGHSNAHGAISPFKMLNDIVSTFATEFVGSY